MQVDSHLQLLCHVLSLLSGSEDRESLQHCRALLLHMAVRHLPRLGNPCIVIEGPICQASYLTSNRRETGYQKLAMPLI